MNLRLYRVCCNVDNGMERGIVYKRILCYTAQDATETIVKMFRDEGDLVKHISTVEIELHDRMIL